MAEDRYANAAGIAVTESAAGTITFNEKLTGVGFGTGKGMLIDEIQYFIPAASAALLVGDGDAITVGLTTSQGVTNLEDTNDGRIMDSVQISLQLLTGVGYLSRQMPLVHQFFPSLITANLRLYAAVVSASLASVATARIRFLWRRIDLTDRNIAELVQATLLQD